MTFRGLRGIRAVLLLVASAVPGGLVVAVPAVQADSVCIPSAEGVPGEPGPPDWWSVVTGRKDDPRWCGATGVGHALNQGRFLALHSQDAGQDYLFLRWEIRGGTGGTAEDHLHFGFVDPVTVTGNAFRITIPTEPGFPVDQQPIAPTQVQWRRKLATGVAWSPLQITDSSTAPWLQATGRYWVACPGVCDSFVVQLRIPIDPTATPDDIDGGLPLSDVFLFWYDMMVSSNTVPPVVAHHTFPEGHPYSIANFLDPSYPSPVDWTEAKILSTIDCLPGVSLSESQVFVTHGVSAEPTHTITTENTFHAAPRNESGEALDGDAVTARFRIANWDQGGADPAWSVVTNCGAATGSGSVADGADFDLTCTWDPDMATLCEYRPEGPGGDIPPWDECVGAGSLSSQQWVLVDLSAGPGATGDVFFAVASAGHAFAILQDNATSAAVASQAAHAALYQNTPNPFDQATTIRFHTSRPGYVTLSVYNVTGQLLRMLLAEETPSGNHQVTWDARSDGGARLASGMYFYRLVTGERSTTRAMILVK